MKKYLPLIIVILIAACLLGFFIYLGIKNIRTDYYSHFGEFYGGFLGTIIALMALIYAFNNYLSQNKQLKLTFESNSIDTINKMLNELNSEIDRISYKDYEGVKALYKFDEEHWTTPNSVMNHLILIFTSFESLILTIKTNKYLDVSIKDSYLAKVYLLFNGKITWPVNEKIYNVLIEDMIENGQIKCKGLKHHNDIFIILNKYEGLIKESYKYLINKGLLTRPTDFKILKLVNE